MLILASASPRRLDLLRQINITPDHVIPADINETEGKRELPAPYAKRMALEKAEKIAADQTDAFVLAADTVVAVGRRILPKAETPEQARQCLEMLSGRSHKVLGGICLIHPDGKKNLTVCSSTVKMKRLTEAEIQGYVDSGEWDGKAGGYAIQGQAERFIKSIQGSVSNIIGLNLYQTANYLTAAGFKV